MKLLLVAPSITCLQMPMYIFQIGIPAFWLTAQAQFYNYMCIYTIWKINATTSKRKPLPIIKYCVSGQKWHAGTTLLEGGLAHFEKGGADSFFDSNKWKKRRKKKEWCGTA